jgi:hypothetical protein
LIFEIVGCKIIRAPIRHHPFRCLAVSSLGTGNRLSRFVSKLLQRPSFWWEQDLTPSVLFTSDALLFRACTIKPFLLPLKP